VKGHGGVKGDRGFAGPDGERGPPGQPGVKVRSLPVMLIKDII